jgi:hemerythrin-like domain-containing protein
MATSLKRDPKLQLFSRDHGLELVCVQQLQRAVRSSANERSRIAQEMKSVLKHFILNYVYDEERILSPVIPDGALKDKFVEHHLRIRRLSSKIEMLEAKTDPGLGLIARLADAIDDYVRWEEHVLFPALEKSLPSDQLDNVSERASNLEITRDRPTQSMHRSVHWG